MRPGHAHESTVAHGSVCATIRLGMRHELREYVEDGVSPFARWFNRLAPATAARIDKYLRRMGQGNFGDSKSVGGGGTNLARNGSES